MSNAVLSQSDGPPAAVKTGFIVALVLAACSPPSASWVRRERWLPHRASNRRRC
jgi:hypothetical protein